MNSIVKRLPLLLALSLLLIGCGKEETPSTPTPVISGVSGTARLKINYSSDLPSMIDRYMEAVVIPQGATADQSLGKTTVDDIGHTKGLPNQQNIKVAAQNLDPELPYQVLVNIYEGPEKTVHLYTGTCEPANCLVITQNNPTDVGITIVPVAQEDVLYQYSVPESIRAQCLVGPTQENCGQQKDRVYYDATANTCKRFTYSGCGETEPFSSMPLCQQGCIK